MFDSNYTRFARLMARVVPLIESDQNQRAWKLLSRASELLTARLMVSPPSAAKFLALVGDFESRHGRTRRAAHLSRQASRRFGRSDEPSNLDLARDLDALAKILDSFGYGWIEELGLTDSDFILVQGYRRIAVDQCRQGSPDRAEPFLRQALNILQEKAPVDHPELASLYIEIAESSRIRGHDNEAERALCRALDIYQGLLTARHPGLLPASRRLASLYFEIGDWAAAEPLLLNIRDIYLHCLGPKHPSFARSQSDLADLFVRLGKRAEAEALYHEAIEIFQCFPASNRRHLAHLFLALAHLHRLEERTLPAEVSFHRAWKVAATALGKYHMTAARIANDLGTFYHDQGRLRAAHSLYEHAIGVLRRNPEKNFAVLGGCLRNLALLFRQQGEADRAADLDLEYALLEATVT